VCCVCERREKNGVLHAYCLLILLHTAMYKGDWGERRVGKSVGVEDILPARLDRPILIKDHNSNFRQQRHGTKVFFHSMGSAQHRWTSLKDSNCSLAEVPEVYS